jgi:flagellar hook-basal body complex protein FliE
MINNVNPFNLTTQPILVQQKTNVLNTNSNTSKPSFADALKKSIEQINQSQIESDKMTEALATGKNVELHDVMISAQKASVTMSLAVEVRNKAIEAYQEMMRMQV